MRNDVPSAVSAESLAASIVDRDTVAGQLAQKRLTRLPGALCIIEPGALCIAIMRCLGRKLEGRYVGSDGENLLIFRLPPIPRLKERLLIDNGVVVKYEHQGCIYQFQAHALRLVYRPVPMLFVDMPTSLFRIDLRSSPRIACMTPMTLRGKHGDHDGVICDLSEEGIRAKFKLNGSSSLRRAMPGDQLVASFSLGEFGVIMAQVTVRRIESDMNRVSLGLQITGLDAMEARAIKDYIDRVMSILN